MHLLIETVSEVSYVTKRPLVLEKLSFAVKSRSLLMSIVDDFLNENFWADFWTTLEKDFWVTSKNLYVFWPSRLKLYAHRKGQLKHGIRTLNLQRCHAPPLLLIGVVTKFFSNSFWFLILIFTKYIRIFLMTCMLWFRMFSVSKQVIAHFLQMSHQYVHFLHMDHVKEIIKMYLWNFFYYKIRFKNWKTFTKC